MFRFKSCLDLFLISELLLNEEKWNIFLWSDHDLKYVTNVKHQIPEIPNQPFKMSYLDSTHEIHKK